MRSRTLLAVLLLSATSFLAPAMAPAVPLPPDLVVDAIVLSPAGPKADDRVVYDVTVRNQGVDPAGAFYVEVKLDGARLVLQHVAGLAGNATVTLRVQGPAVAPGARTVSAEADAPDNAQLRHVVEADELNNVRSVSFQVDGQPREEFVILDEYFAQFDLGRSSAGTILRTLGLETALAPQGEPLTHAQRNETNNLLLLEHARWHRQRTLQSSLLKVTAAVYQAYGAIDQDTYGKEFLDFHHDLITKYDDWRKARGYPRLDAWEPVGAIPSKFAYSPRAASEADHPRPEWTRVTGDGPSADPLFGYVRLGQFGSENRLGKSIDAGKGTVPLHGRTHGHIGGDMGSLDTAPKDPVFWAYHRYLDDIYEEWKNATRDPYGANDPSVTHPAFHTAVGALSDTELADLRAGIHLH